MNLIQLRSGTLGIIVRVHNYTTTHAHTLKVSAVLVLSLICSYRMVDTVRQSTGGVCS